jgi:hypothetical protein
MTAGADQVRGANQVGLILAGRVVQDEHGLAGADLRQDVR